MPQDILKISELNKIISDQINALGEFEVEGEISEWKMFGGKLFYFKLKDEKSSISAMTNIFELKNWKDFEEGMLVRAKVAIKFNQVKGNLYAWIEEMSPHGEGALKIALEKLKMRLQSEGLFSPERKRPVARYPRQIGLITSKDGAAIKDFHKILNARTGGLKVYFYPVKVEGREAISSILGAFEFFNSFKESLDAIVLVRGGGSLENLQAFNDERVARCVAGSRFPVVCGIGHEHDISICDLCADVRASTPSNAAELLVENKLHTNEIINGLVIEIKAAIKLKISRASNLEENIIQSI
jgi:exodeoxyribonuclease VII large subunit